jgi:hypothetical protein
LPLAFSGISATTVTTAGTLYDASRSRQNARSDSCSISTAAVGGQDGHPVALADAPAPQRIRQPVDPPVHLRERTARPVVEDEAVTAGKPLRAEPQEVARLNGI